MHELGSAASGNCHRERVSGQLPAQRLAHGPAHNCPGIHIQNGRQVQPALACWEWSERPGVVELFPGLSSPNRTCTSQRIRLSIQVLLKAKATSA